MSSKSPGETASDSHPDPEAREEVEPDTGHDEVVGLNPEQELARLLDGLEQSSPDSRYAIRKQLLELTARLMLTDHGLDVLAKGAHRFELAGVFRGGPWEASHRLIPQLVRGGLLADDLTAALECLSELRMLAIAKGSVAVEEVSKREAWSFVRDVVVLNLDLLAPTSTEASRGREDTFERARRLISLLLSQLKPAQVERALLEEVEQRLAQRPIDTTATQRLMEHLDELPPTPGADRLKLRLLVRAATRPTELSRKVSESDYAAACERLTKAARHQEARELGEALRLTGIGTPHHAVFVRTYRDDPDLLVMALRADAIGEAAIRTYGGFISELIETAITPDTSFALFGLAQMLERGLMSSRAVVRGLRRLSAVRMTAEATRALMARQPASTVARPVNIAIAGALAVLGQPLGVAQGNAPTCQSARAISMWSQHSPGYLINLYCAVLREGRLRMNFEGQPLFSDQLPASLGPALDLDVDPVSRVLVPHLDRIYGAMLERARFRPDDPHHWVNPAFYGRFVPDEFACAVLFELKQVRGYDGFIRRFYATYHPTFCEDDELVYPNPLGLIVTDAHGRLLGAHAVSLLRVAVDPRGQIRCYFFNPNQEGRQDWGQGVRTAVVGTGERPGESSLPFDQFASRLYAFHYPTYAGTEPDAVPSDVVLTVERMAYASWGRDFVGWTSQPEEDG